MTKQTPREWASDIVKSWLKTVSGLRKASIVAQIDPSVLARIIAAAFEAKDIQIEQSQAQLEEAKRLLEPFAAIGRELEPEMWDGKRLLFAQGSGVTVAHCRAAREFLEKNI